MIRALFVLMLFVFVGCKGAPPPEPDTLPAGSPEPVTERPRRAYIGDVPNKVFHRDGCPDLKNVDLSKQRLLENPGEAADAGYRPCKTCEPFKGW